MPAFSEHQVGFQLAASWEIYNAADCILKPSVATFAFTVIFSLQYKKSIGLYSDNFDKLVNNYSMNPFCKIFNMKLVLLQFICWG